MALPHWSKRTCYIIALSIQLSMLYKCQHCQLLNTLFNHLCYLVKLQLTQFSLELVLKAVRVDMC